MAGLIALFLANAPLFLLILALVLGAFKWTGESFTRYLLLLPIGIGGLWAFIFHAFMPEFAAERIGWATSPFQSEIAAANLGLGIAGVYGFWRNWDFAFAVTLMAVCFLLGAACVHIYQLLFFQDLAPGNAGTILYTDMLIPLMLALTVCLWKREMRQKKDLGL